jgi:hypothetical protein
MLDLSFYNSIEAIPTMIGQLQHLARLWLIDCENLKEHLQSIARLSSVSMLDLFGCNSIESLLTTIGQLQHLTNLLLK